MVEHGQQAGAKPLRAGHDQDPSHTQDVGPVPAESTVTLLDRYRHGDEDALNTLYARYLGPLRRWARGRLPQWARDAADTEDLVQDTLVQALKRLDAFEPRGAGALGGYLRQALLNRIVDKVRRGPRHLVSELPPHMAGHERSPLEELMGQQVIDRYEAALAQLKSEEREAVVGRLELDMPYAELAAALDKTPDAVRMMVSRALLKMAKAMSGA